jgi:AcrR family transcriptional regulator
MAHIGNERPARAYRSRLRADHAEETRARILDATLRVIASGIASLSIPAVARQSGVSIPTIYRHFGTKADLVAAIYPHLMGRAAFDATRIVPQSVSEFREMIRGIFARLDSLDDLARAAMASPAAEEVRRANMPDRIAMSRQFVGTVAPAANDADRERITRLMVVLTSSAAMRVWRDYFGSSADRAADDVKWALGTAIAAASQGTDR